MIAILRMHSIPQCIGTGLDSLLAKVSRLLRKRNHGNQSRVGNRRVDSALCIVFPGSDSVAQPDVAEGAAVSELHPIAFRLKRFFQRIRSGAVGKGTGGFQLAAVSKDGEWNCQAQE